MKRRILSLAMCVLLVLSVFAGCKNKEDEKGYSTETDIINDSYRNWYEIFVYSYADSDGDGIGDIKGMTEKLDYVKDMGYNGIWLMPIMPSPSYHKYDVTDYYSIDPQYGTLEDFRAFMEEAHKRDIWVIIDLVVNHTSSEHPWFKSSISSDSDYREWYNWTDTRSPGYSSYGSDYSQFYECRFVDTMPDLNLDNSEVRDEIRNIMKFWLSDMDVDGFRLDAVTSYYTGAPGKSTEFLSFINEESEKIKPGCFIVGEAWTDLVSIAGYYESGVDAFFCFPTAQATGYIGSLLSALSKEPARSYEKALTTISESFGEDVIQANFLGNHDTSRTGSFLPKEEKLKFAAGLLAMMNGGCFTYYGEEIGMCGSGDDPNKRVGMLWTTEDETTSTPPGTTSVRYKYPGVEAQQEDPLSILNYYKQAMLLRNQHPEIARGTVTIHSCDDPFVSTLEKTWNDDHIAIVINFSDEEKTVSINGSEFDVTKAAGELLVSDVSADVENNNGTFTLTMPAYSIIILD